MTRLLALLLVAAPAVAIAQGIAPNHGWRHRFKTVGMQAGIPPRILDAIQGQVSGAVADTYGDVTLRTQAENASYSSLRISFLMVVAGAAGGAVFV
jgi:hypothetical protein